MQIVILQTKTFIIIIKKRKYEGGVAAYSGEPQYRRQVVCYGAVLFKSVVVILHCLC